MFLLDSFVSSEFRVECHLNFFGIIEVNSISSICGADENNSLVFNTKNWDGNGTDTQNGGEYDEDERLTPAERRYMEQRRKIELERLAKAAKKSHRDRIQEFNQYLANLSEHYDIPKVGPG